MFEIKDIYQMLKPKGEANLITKYSVVIGGTKYAQNFVKGVIIVSLINSEVLTSQSKHFIENPKDENTALINESSYIQYNFQIDIYKQNDDNVTEIQAFSEALKIREWLKSLKVQEYLREKESEILPNYAIIQMTSEIIENKLINRAFFEFSIVGKMSIIETDDKIESVKITDLILRQGVNDG